MALERSTLTLIVNIITIISPWNSECNRFQNVITSPFSLISGLILLILTWMQQIMMVGQMETKIIFLSWKNLESSGRTALHLAACEGHLACVRFSRNQNLLYVLIGTPGLCQVVLPTSNFYVLHSHRATRSCVRHFLPPLTNLKELSSRFLLEVCEVEAEPRDRWGHTPLWDAQMFSRWAKSFFIHSKLVGCFQDAQNIPLCRLLLISSLFLDPGRRWWVFWRSTSAWWGWDAMRSRRRQRSQWPRVDLSWHHTKTHSPDQFIALIFAVHFVHQYHAQLNSNMK